MVSSSDTTNGSLVIDPLWKEDEKFYESCRYSFHVISRSIGVTTEIYTCANIKVWQQDPTRLHRIKLGGSVVPPQDENTELAVVYELPALKRGSIACPPFAYCVISRCEHYTPEGEKYRQPGSRVWYYKAERHRKQKHLRRAVWCYRRAVSIDPNYTEAWYNCGIALEKLGRSGKAWECYERAAELGHKTASNKLKRKRKR